MVITANMLPSCLATWHILPSDKNKVKFIIITVSVLPSYLATLYILATYRIKVKQIPWDFLADVPTAF